MFAKLCSAIHHAPIASAAVGYTTERPGRSTRSISPFSAAQHAKRPGAATKRNGAVVQRLAPDSNPQINGVAIGKKTNLHLTVFLPGLPKAFQVQQQQQQQHRINLAPYCECFVPSRPAIEAKRNVFTHVCEYSCCHMQAKHYKCSCSRYKIISSCATFEWQKP